MRKSLRRSSFFIIGVTVSGFLFSIYYIRIREIQQSSIGKLKVQEVQPRIVPSVPPIDPQPPQSPSFLIPEDPVRDCECTSEATGKKYDFCYIDPQNSTSIGKKFDCGHLKFLEKLNLVDNPGPFVNLSNATTIENDTVIVSAVSDSHVKPAIRSLQLLRKFGYTLKFIIYGLNLNSTYAKHYDNLKNVEYRLFNTSGYPEYVNDWMTYRFKPLIIAEVMKEYPCIWWIDAHITMTQPNMTQFLSKELAEQQNQAAPTSSIFFFIRAIHSNYAALMPELLDYFPTNSIPLLKSEQLGTQLGANTFFAARTEYTVKIFKWWILCALDEKCISPPGAKIGCSFGLNFFEYSAHCHRQVRPIGSQPSIAQ